MALIRGRSSQEKAELLRGILLGVRVCVRAHALPGCVLCVGGGGGGRGPGLGHAKCVRCHVEPSWQAAGWDPEAPEWASRPKINSEACCL